MAVPKTARLVGARAVGPRARRLEFELTEPEMLGFTGGQYIIIDSGMTLPSGKAAKRAYSIASSDAEQTRFELVARRIDGGVCSNFLHALEPGATLKFSGPWGKFLPAPIASESTLIVATDTGITAALGLLRGTAFRDRLARTTLLWLMVSADDFVSEPFVRERLPHGKDGELREVRVAQIPPVSHPERLHAGLVQFDFACASAAPERVYLAGDVALLYPFARALAATGLAESHIAIESFFNVPAKKVGVSAGGDAT